MDSLNVLWKKWVYFAQKLGDFNARVLLTIFYFTLLLPFSLVTTLFTDRMKKKKLNKTNWQNWTENYQTLDEARSQY